tara:strand:+ start:3601 stop:4110 length:510 start_codon:yes stop_codon:yes gene_type:complete
MTTRAFNAQNVQSSRLDIQSGIIGTQPFMYADSYVSPNSLAIEYGMPLVIDAAAVGYLVDASSGAVNGQVMKMQAIPTDDGAGNITWVMNGIPAGLALSSGEANDNVINLAFAVYLAKYIDMTGVSTIPATAEFTVADLKALAGVNVTTLRPEIASGQAALKIEFDVSI